MAKKTKSNGNTTNAKLESLDKFRANSADELLTTNQGARISDNHNSLKAGPRGPTLMEDFILREKITHFDHERIPERIVHARGEGAFGYFECTKEMSKYTRASFLNQVGLRTPVLARFSTVAGSRGSADTVRDARGFAVKFYTQQGNYDLVGNNIPVFFIQDAMKFPDLVHAVKPEPHNEMPQAASAHDTFWDFISLMPESLHMIMWVMSDRAIPRSLRMMEGFGVHTFRFVNADGASTFVKFHWKPKLGSHALTWDEASTLAGKDADFHRRDLWEAIESGNFPEWDLGVQLIPEADEDKFPFDLLDATKLVPEEMVPVQRIGKLVLNRNPDNFFSQIEQAAFHPGHVVDGIDFTNDPLLQGRLFSYTDTQLIRLGGPNFHELPVNRPLAPVHNNQRDGFGRQTIDVGRVAYEPNTLARGCPMHSPEKLKGFVSHAEKVDAHKVRARSPSFADHLSQPRLFLRSQSPIEQEHIAGALLFELSKVETVDIRKRMLVLLAQIDPTLAKAVADGLGLPVPKNGGLPPSAADPKNNIVPPNRATEIARRDNDASAKTGKGLPEDSAALSMVRSNPGGIEGRVVALLVSDGIDAAQVTAITRMLEDHGARVETVGQRLGAIKPSAGAAFEVTKTLESTPSLVFDAVVVPGGKAAADSLADDGRALHFVAQAFKHHKTLAFYGSGVEVLKASPIRFDVSKSAHGVLISEASPAAMKALVQEIGKHRHWDRPGVGKIPV
jgi:catalase